MSTFIVIYNHETINSDTIENLMKSLLTPSTLYYLIVFAPTFNWALSIDTTYRHSWILRIQVQT